ncbi:tyrosine-type recombinase/integrase [Actinomadura montaniterrae]|uniref:Site-specific integrase n=1 Tax=Actinomadura montaniterrae TaxID=1803903 RepID=A0A6L3VZN5_9ACTN|nr:site-specific integrase [Actinomadura montaniterrae]KAB2386423.1 site-specific integrase [Actinomadura montaniterrae]
MSGKKRRAHGEGGLSWNAARKRWIASKTVGYQPNGRRIIVRGSGKTQTDALKRLKKNLEKRKARNAPKAAADVTIAEAVAGFLRYGLMGRDESTVTNAHSLAKHHIVPQLGHLTVRELTADDCEQWLEGRAEVLATKSLREVRSVLRRSIARVMRRDERVTRNVVDLCQVPSGKRSGRPSKALNFAQAMQVLAAAERARSDMRQYVVLALLTGARTEELRKLTWSHVVAYDGARGQWRPVHETGWEHGEFAVYVWRSVRARGDTKTKKSRRTLKLPQRCVVALRDLWEGFPKPPDPEALIFPGEGGQVRGAMTVLRAFRREVIAPAGLDPDAWTPRELRHSFVSLLSDNGMPLDKIALLVGHSGTQVTEKVYRQQIRPVIQDGAQAMDLIFPNPN